MKRRIIIGSIIFSLVLFVYGLFIIFNIEKSTKELDHLIMLHQVEILREHLLIHIKKVQSDLNLKNTRYAETVDNIVHDVRNMQEVADSCFGCHHEPAVTERLNNLRNHMENYRNSLSRVFTIRANTGRLQLEEDSAFRTGEDLITKVDDMIAFTSSRLRAKTQATLRKISNTKISLFVLISVMTLLTGGIAYVVVRGIAKPIKVLLDGTRRLKSGDLDYRMEGLQDEFGEVSLSFNSMADALKNNMIRMQETVDALQQSEERYRSVVNQSADCIFLVDVDTMRIVDANLACQNLLGYSHGEILEMQIYDFIAHSKDDIDEKTRIILERRSHYIGERLYRRKDGTIVDVEVSATLVTFQDRRVICIMARDITERKKAEAALREGEKRYRLLFESARDAIFIIDTEGDRMGQIIAANRAAAEMHGYTVAEMIRMNMRDLDTSESAQGMSRRIERILNGEWITEEIYHRRKDNSVLPVEISAGLLDHGGHKYILAFDRDISERKNAEYFLQRTEQMRVVGELATGLAHEIKNPLAAVKIATEVLNSELTLPEEDHETLSKMMEEILQIESLIKSLLNFARPSKPQILSLDLNNTLERAIGFLAMKEKTLSSENAKPIRVETRLDKSMPRVMADPSQLQQVFVNLLMNAADAMPEGGTLTARTRFDPARNAVEVEITDTGKGIDEEIREKIFQPFFTTKSKGTGMGLAITRQIVEQHGGRITAAPGPKMGTVFTIVLPLNGHRV